ncbi:MAG: hypothetical protein Q8P45_00885 [Candidatus Harrisonbacteria bacterium]|nr:hypothetical protein [Candidatus Harrisonbacteria bacterium]
MAQNYADLDQKLLKQVTNEAADLYHKGMSVERAAREIISHYGLPDLWRKAICSKLGKRGSKVKARRRAKMLTVVQIANLVEKLLEREINYFRAVAIVVKQNPDCICQTAAQLRAPVGRILAKRRWASKDPQVKLYADL